MWKSTLVYQGLFRYNKYIELYNEYSNNSAGFDDGLNKTHAETGCGDSSLPAVSVDVDDLTLWARVIFASVVKIDQEIALLFLFTADFVRTLSLC